MGWGAELEDPPEVPRVTSPQLPPLPTKQPDDPSPASAPSRSLFLVKLNMGGGGEVTLSSSLILVWIHFLARNEGRRQKGGGGLGSRGRSPGGRGSGRAGDCPGEAPRLSALNRSVDTFSFCLGWHGQPQSHDQHHRRGERPCQPVWNLPGHSGVRVRACVPSYAHQVCREE